MAILKIYRIVNTINDHIYIGSTIQTLNERFNNHKYDANRGSTTSLHKLMREIGVENFKIELIKTVEMKTPEEYEQEVIDIYNPNIILNDVNAFPKIDKNARRRNYRKQNPERYREYDRRKYIKNKEKKQVKELAESMIELVLDNVFEKMLDNINEEC